MVLAVTKRIRKLFGEFSGLACEPTAGKLADAPLIVAIHGGTYTSRYFDIPGYSLLSRAAAAGMRVIAPDRNGYGTSPALSDATATIIGSARSLALGLSMAWREFGDGCPGMVLIGHSIGGAIAAHIAADPGELPVLGIAITGIGLRMPEHNRAVRAELPRSGLVEMPAATKDMLMFGPPGSYDTDTMPAASRVADAASPRAELEDISSRWPRRARSVLGAIRVPVHYRQGECDRLWVVGDEES